jgi:hypothetical protein
VRSIERCGPLRGVNNSDEERQHCLELVGHGSKFRKADQVHFDPEPSISRFCIANVHDAAVAKKIPILSIAVEEFHHVFGHVRCLWFFESFAGHD